MRSRHPITPCLAGTLALLLGYGLSPAAPARPSWVARPGGREAPVHFEPGLKQGFTRLSADQTGLHFTNFIPAQRHYTNQVFLNGSGVAAGDVDGDGLCDLFLAGLEGRSALYRNHGGWRFQDVTAASGIDCRSLDASGVAFADLDGDGDLDLVLNSYGLGTLAFVNDGRGRFARSPIVLNPGRCGSSLALADIDGDGALDLYIANYRLNTIRDQPNMQFNVKTVDGQPQVVSVGGRSLTNADLAARFSFRYRMSPGGGGSVLHDELGEADVLYRNVGAARWVPLSFTNGGFLDQNGAPLTNALYDWGLSVMLRDLNGDGAPDIYVCNDFTTPDRIWINDGKGRFRAAPETAIRQTSLSTMAMDVADINRDGHYDIFTADMLSLERWRRLVQRNEANPNMHLFVDVVGRPQFPRNMLQLGRGDGSYAEVAQLAGLEASEWTWTSLFLDVDLDGYEDLLVANGFERDYMNMDANRQVSERRLRGGRQMSAQEILNLNRLYPRLETPNLAFRNLGNLRFKEVSADWSFNLNGVSQGMCLADLDNDGDLDVVVSNLNGPAVLLRNDAPGPRIAVRLKGRPPNTRGIGAQIRLRGGAVPFQNQEMICGGRYLSSDDALRVFAPGSHSQGLALEVIWRDGGRSLLTNILPNRIYEVDQAGALPAPRETAAPEAPTAKLFADASATLAHRHRHEPFDDFERQPLLPNRLSTLGPGVAWFDLDADGADDLLIGGGKGSALAAFRNDRRGGFTRMTNRVFDVALPRSQTTVLGWREPDSSTGLVAGSSNYEDGATNAAVARQYFHAALKVDEPFPGSPSATGPLALADIDGDGDLDLFVGGRCLPGRWPEAASSLLFRRSEGKWLPDHDASSSFARLGLVSGAVFADLDADGDPDLALACEWGPLRVFRNAGGRFAEVTAELGLASCTGWWNSVTTGDFDADGSLDLVAGNWGRNTKYERFSSRPLQVFFGDFNGDGGVGIVESCYDPTLAKQTPILNVWTMSRALPWLLQQFPSFESFSRASVQEVLGERYATARHYDAQWPDSTLFLNRGDHFEIRPLPIEAQVAPVFGIVVADFDGDGNDDIFLAQNFFGTRPDTSRYDAGRGLLLRGDGTGGFVALDGQRSGLLIYGEQRGAAASDYDGNGRVDLAVAQFNGDTKLYRNDSARPGLRVRLAGPPANPQGVGAVIRLQFAGRLGPARAVHAGSGYWSQDSGVVVMCGSESPSALQVRWPGGTVTSSPLPPECLEVSVQPSGRIQKLR